MSSEALHRGDTIEIKSPSEILETLDAKGALGELPFMPEMVPLCGQRFTVDRRAERVCDTIHYTGSRRLRDTVLLDDRRCDGAAHGGCQAECRFFWKEAWLRKVAPAQPPAGPFSTADVAALVARTAPQTSYEIEESGERVKRFRCQATELPKATEHIKLWDARSYLRELTSGNVSLPHFLIVAARAVVQEPMRKLGMIPEIHLKGARTAPVADPPLELQPGDLVRVKSKEAIAATLSPQGRNRGLWFDMEMMPYCGQTFRVRRRVHNFIDDHDGHMVELKTDAVTLEGAICSGDRSLRRWFCPRAIFPYWRECWLERVEETVKAAG